MYFFRVIPISRSVLMRARGSKQQQPDVSNKTEGATGRQQPTSQSQSLTTTPPDNTNHRTTSDLNIYIKYLFRSRSFKYNISELLLNDLEFNNNKNNQSKYHAFSVPIFDLIISLLQNISDILIFDPKNKNKNILDLISQLEQVDQ